MMELDFHHSEAHSTEVVPLHLDLSGDPLFTDALSTGNSRVSGSSPANVLHAHLIHPVSPSAHDSTTEEPALFKRPLKQNASPRSSRDTKPDRAWFFTHGQERFEHLLRNPPGTYDVEERTIAVSDISSDKNTPAGDGTLSIVLDSKREIDPSRWLYASTEPPVNELVPSEHEERRFRTSIAPLSLLQDENKIEVSSPRTGSDGGLQLLPHLHPIPGHQLHLALHSAEEKLGGVAGSSNGGGDSLDMVDVSNESMLQLVRLIYKEQEIYNAVFYEAIRECTVHCAERGHFLSDLRGRYVEVLKELPKQLMGVHRDMLARRSLDRRLAEHFVVYKKWWNSTQPNYELDFEHARQVYESLNVDETSTSLSEHKIIEKNDAVTVDRDSNYGGSELIRPLHMYKKIFENQKASLQADMEDLAAETRMWQDLAHTLMGELMKSCKYPEFSQLDAARPHWREAAEIIRDSIDQEDKKIIGALREMNRNRVTEVRRLETILMTSQSGLINQLENIGHGFANFFAAHREHYSGDCGCIEHLPKLLQTWVHDTHSILLQFEPAILQSKQDLLSKVKKEFGSLIFEGLSAMVSHCRHDRFTATMYHNNQASEVDEKDEAFRAEETFNEMLHSRRELDLDLSCLHAFPALTDLFHLHCHFTAYQEECRKMISGPDVSPKLLGDLIESMDHLLALIEDNSVSFFKDSGRLTNHIFCFIEKLTSIKRCLELQEDSKTDKIGKKTSLKDLIRKLTPVAKSWILKYENELVNSVNAVSHKIIGFTENMFLFGINGMLLVTPDLVFEEERYKQLYKKHLDDDVERAIGALEREKEKLGKELTEFSGNLEFMAESGNTKREERNFVSSCQGPCSIKANVWIHMAKNVMEVIYRDKNVDKETGFGTSMKTPDHHLPDSGLEHKLDVEELRKLIYTKVDRQDFVARELPPDEVNIYVKPFRIFAEERSLEEKDECTVEYNERLCKEIEVQRELNTETENKISEMRKEIAKAKDFHERLQGEVAVLREEQKGSFAMAARFTDSSPEITVLLSNGDLSAVLDSKAKTVLEEQEWTAQVDVSQKKDFEFILRNAEVNFDRASIVSEINRKLGEHRKKLEKAREMYEPLIKMGFIKQQEMKLRKRESAANK